MMSTLGENLDQYDSNGNIISLEKDMNDYYLEVVNSPGGIYVVEPTYSTISHTPNYL